VVSVAFRSILQDVWGDRAFSVSLGNPVTPDPSFFGLRIFPRFREFRGPLFFFASILLLTSAGGVFPVKARVAP